MNCKLPHISALDNSRQFLIDLEAIDDSNKILDDIAFDSIVKDLEQDNIKAYQVSGKPWLRDITKGGEIAIPNIEVLNKIDQKRKDLGLYKDQLSADLSTHFMIEEENGYSVLTALWKIKERNLIYPELINKINDLLKVEEFSVPIYLTNDDVFDSPLDYANYDPVNNVINIRKNGYFPEKFSDQTVLHEIIHAMTYNKVLNNPSHRAKLELLLEVARQEIEKKYGKVNYSGKWYGLKNEFEFLAEGFSNPEFIKELMSIQHWSQSLFDDFLDWIFDTLGIKKELTIYNELYDLFVEITNLYPRPNKVLTEESKFPNMEIVFRQGEEQIIPPNEQVMYQLRVVNALQSDKVRQPKLSNLQGFYNDLQKQGIPSQQIPSNIRTGVTPELYNHLVTFAKKINPDFRIEIIDNLFERRGVYGIANFKEFLIQLQRGKETALVEEVVHFAIELLDNNSDLKKRLYEESPRTRLYKEVYEEYKNIYKGNVERIKGEVAAKLVSFYLTDKKLFEYYVGSPTLIENFIRWIKDFFRWLKGQSKSISSYIEIAEKITNLDTSGLVLEQARNLDEMYSLSELRDNIEVLETVDNVRHKDYDVLFININDTILDYQNYKGIETDRKKIFFDSRYSEERDLFYKTADLTSFGEELADKIRFFGNKKIIFYTAMPISPALESRLIELYGPNIEIINSTKEDAILDEDGKIIKIDTIPVLQDRINDFKNQRKLLIDNSFIEVSGIEYRRFNFKSSPYYQSIESRIKQRHFSEQRKKQVDVLVEELKSLGVNTILQKVKQSFFILSGEEGSIKRLEERLSTMSDEEISQLFRDRFGNLSLPVDRNKIAVKLIEEFKKIEEGIIEFIGVIESMTGFFKSRNESNFEKIRELIMTGGEKNIDTAIQELYELSKIGLSWETYVSQFRQELINLPNTSNIQSILGALLSQIELTREITRDITKQALGISLSSALDHYNFNKQSEIKSLEERLNASSDEVEIERYKRQIKNIERKIVKPEDIIAILNGEIKDISGFTVWIKLLHESGDPLIGSVNKIIQKAFAQVEVDTIRRAQLMGERVEELKKQYNITDEEIRERLIDIEKIHFYVPPENEDEEGKWEIRQRLTLLNQWQNTHEYFERRLPVIKAKKEWLTSKENNEDEQVISKLKEEYVKQLKLFEQWENANWYREYTPKFYNRYLVLQLTDEDYTLFQEIQEEQFEIYRQIESISLDMMASQELEYLFQRNKDIELLRRILKEMKRSTYNDGSPKVGKDLKKAELLQKKGEIDRQVYEYYSDHKRFADDFSIFLSTIVIEEDIKLNLLRLSTNTENYTALYNYAKNNAPQEVIDYLDLNTVTRIDPKWYENRTKITERISEIIKTLNLLENKEDNTTLEEKWKELFLLTSPLRDEDNIFDGSLATPEIQRKVKQFEEEIERLKKKLKEDVQERTNDPEIKKLKSELKQLIELLRQIQSKQITEAYKDTFFDMLSQTGFSELLNIHISTISDIRHFIGTSAFETAIKKNPEHPFVVWFLNNHHIKIDYDENENEINYYVPTYIWYKIEPSDPEYIMTVPSYKYGKRKVKEGEDLITPKTNWVTWNPITKKWLPKSQDFQNSAYKVLRTSTNPKEQGLFQILKEITNFHIDTQLQNPVVEARLGFGLPYVSVKSLETGSYLRNMFTTFFDKNNRFEQGEGNYDESIEPEGTQGIKNKIIRWWNGMTGEEESEQNAEINEYRKSHRLAVPYVHYMDIKDVSRDILLTTTMFAASTAKAYRMLKTNSTLKLIEDVLENPPIKDKKGRIVQNNNNRLKALRFTQDYYVYGVNQQYELNSRFVEDSLRTIRKINTIGSLGFPFGFANTLKNNLQGRLQNIIGARFADWSTNRSMRKASLNTRTNFISYITESGKPLGRRSLDYHIISFFNPELDSNIYQNIHKGTPERILRDKPLFIFNRAMEFSISVNLLYSHLYHVIVINESGEQKELYDILEYKNGQLSVQPGWKDKKTGKEINTDYLIETKLSFKTAAEYVQGRAVEKTLLGTTTIGQVLLYFKNWLIPMLRRRFDTQNPNYMVGEDLEGYWITFFRLSKTMLHDLFVYKKIYWGTFTEEEKRNYETSVKEIGFMMISLALISLVFGFDADDPDKYKKLKDNSYAENMALLIMLQAKNETESLSAMPFLNIEQGAIPPVLTEGVRWIKNPTIGFSIIDNMWKATNSLYDLMLNRENAYYDRNMPYYNIVEGESKFQHYLTKVFQIDDLLYQTNPEGKIRSVLNIIKQ